MGFSMIPEQAKTPPGGNIIAGVVWFLVLAAGCVLAWKLSFGHAHLGAALIIIWITVASVGAAELGEKWEAAAVLFRALFRLVAGVALIFLLWNGLRDKPVQATPAQKVASPQGEIPTVLKAPQTPQDQGDASSSNEAAIFRQAERERRIREAKAAQVRKSKAARAALLRRREQARNIKQQQKKPAAPASTLLSQGSLTTNRGQRAGSINIIRVGSRLELVINSDIRLGSTHTLGLASNDRGDNVVKIASLAKGPLEPRYQLDAKLDTQRLDTLLIWKTKPSQPLYIAALSPKR